MAGEQNKTTDTGEGDGGQTKYMSAEEVTAMVTGANERMRKSLSAEIEKAVKGITESIPETLKAHVEAMKSEVPKPTEAKGDGKSESKPHPETLALQQQLADMKKAMQERDQALAEAEKKAKNDAARNELRSQLAAHVRPEALDMTTQLIFDAQRRVSLSEDGTPVFKVRKSPMAGMPEEDMELPIKDGVANWLKSDDAKFFLPPPASAQTDNRRGSPMPRNIKAGADGLPSYDSPAANDEERVRRADERAQALAAKYPHLNDQL